MAPSSAADRERERIEELGRFEFLCQERRGELERLCQITRQLLDGKSSSVTLIGEHEMTFVSSEGNGHKTMPRGRTFCNLTLEHGAFLEIEDLAGDARTCVMGEELGLRHYAAVPLAPTPGVILGTLNVVGREPRKLTEDQRRNLEGLAGVVEDQMKLYRAGQELREQ